MRPLDPRLLRHARAARGYVALTATLGVVTAALVVAQALLLAHALGAAVSDGATLDVLRPTIAWLAAVVAAGALVVLVVAAQRRSEGLAFTASAVAIVGAVVLIFGSMYPDVMPAFDPDNSLTVTNASSTDYTLTVMTWVAAVLTPLVLLYQGWTYWVFRRRISGDHIPASIGLTFARTAGRPEE